MVTIRLHDGTKLGKIELQSEVKKAQKILGLKQTGVFDRELEEAVRLFQLKNLLVDDGVVGPITWSKLIPEVVKFRGNMKAFNTFNELYLGTVTEECAKYGHSVAVIFGIGYRESLWGHALDRSWTGDYIPRKPTALRLGTLPSDGLGFGRGLMQIDYDAHSFARGTQWRDDAKNIAYGCKVLADNIAVIGKKYRGVQPGPRLSMAIAAYNCGARRVMSAYDMGKDVDYYTAHRNYSAEVIELSRMYTNAVRGMNV